MYTVFLLAHSWLRYFVLAAGLWLLVVAFRGWRAGNAWSSDSDRLHSAFLGLLDLQLLLGLVLYFVVSPFTRIAFEHFGAAMKEPDLRFWAVEHIATMLLAIALAHVGRVRSRKKPTGDARHRTVFAFQLVWLVLTLAAIPWPWLDIGRPLLRF